MLGNILIWYVINQHSDSEQVSFESDAPFKSHFPLQAEL